MTDFPRLAFGTAVLARERLFGRVTANSPMAIMLGLADQGRALAKKIKPPKVKVPKLDIPKILHNAGVRGAIVMRRSRRDAEATLRGVVDGSVDWLVPKVIDDAMPQIREKVLPVLVDDLSRDPKVRKMITDQSQSVVSEAAVELRETSAGADDRLETAFRKLLRR